MKVLLVAPNFYPRVGGIESHLFEVITYLRDVEFSVLTNWRSDSGKHRGSFPNVSFNYVWPADREIRGWFAYLRPAFRGRKVVFSTIEILRTLNRAGWLRRLDTDIVHIHYMEMDQTDRIARRLQVDRLIPEWYRWIVSSAKRGGTVLFTDHTIFTAPEEIVPRATREALLQTFDNIISVDSESYEVVRRYQINHGGRAWFIPNSVDTDRFRNLRRPGGEFRLGYAARLGKLGQGLVKSVARLLGDRVRWHFAVAGEQIDVSGTELRSVDSDAVLHSNLDYQAMPEFYSSIDLLLNPFPGEGIGRTTLEAMSCGVPVVGVGTGKKYPIVDGETGYLVPAEPAAIAEKILTIRNRPDLAKSMADRSRSLIVQEFSNAAVLPKLREVYKDVLAN